MKETIAYDTSPNHLNGQLVNMPTRAMKGHNWSGREMNWSNAQDEYGAIHFHDDDVYDAGWDVDFTLDCSRFLEEWAYMLRMFESGNMKTICLL